MGATFSNCHVRADSVAAISRSLPTLVARRAYIVPSRQGWVTIYDETSEAQGISEIGRIARALSQRCHTVVIAFCVEDSDILTYQLYDAGELRDTYNSCPEYWGPVDVQEKIQLSGNPEVLAHYCVAGTEASAVTEVLQNDAQVLEEDRLARLAELLGIDHRLACTGFDELETPDGKDGLGNLMGVKLIQNKQFSKNADLLILRSEKADIDGVTELLRRGVDANVVDRQNNTPLQAAISGRHLDLVRVLLAAGANPSIPALTSAALRDDLEIVQALIDCGADPSHTVQLGPDVLLSAIRSPWRKSSDMISFLIHAGAPVNERYELHYYAPPKVEVGLTALMYASLKGDVDVVKILIEAGADVNAKTPGGETALSLATARKKDEVVAVLREAGAVE